jgi:hypothetical protein
MRRMLVAGALALSMIDPRACAAAVIRPVVVSMDEYRFSISGEGNTVTGVRVAPVPYASIVELSTALNRPAALPAAVRLVRVAPSQVVDYVFCVTDDGLLIVGQQTRSADGSGRYGEAEGEIKRAYSALEATAPWRWIVDIPLGREVALTLDVRAMSHAWPVRGVTVLPTVSR